VKRSIVYPCITVVSLANGRKSGTTDVHKNSEGIRQIVYRYNHHHNSSIENPSASKNNAKNTNRSRWSNWRNRSIHPQRPRPGWQLRTLLSSNTSPTPLTAPVYNPHHPPPIPHQTLYPYPQIPRLSHPPHRHLSSHIPLPAHPLHHHNQRNRHARSRLAVQPRRRRKSRRRIPLRTMFLHYHRSARRGAQDPRRQRNCFRRNLAT
jgi:hypothetical protein